MEKESGIKRRHFGLGVLRPKGRAILQRRMVSEQAKEEGPD